MGLRRGFPKLRCTVDVHRAMQATVRDAMIECDADGAEFDFEGPGSAAEADVFTTLLIELKIALCKGNLTKDGKASKDCPFVVSADSEPPQWSDCEGPAPAVTLY